MTGTYVTHHPKGAESKPYKVAGTFMPTNGNRGELCLDRGGQLLSQISCCMNMRRLGEITLCKGTSSVLTASSVLTDEQRARRRPLVGSWGLIHRTKSLADHINMIA